MSQLSHEEKMAYTNLFLKIDGELGNGDGAITIDEYEKLLLACGFRLPRELVATSFVHMDTDGNWKITLDEYLAALPKIVPPETPEFNAARFRRIFDIYDENKDGIVTAEELRKVLTQAGEEDVEDLVHYIVTECDEDGDGKLRFDEFLNLYITKVKTDDGRKEDNLEQKVNEDEEKVPE